MVDSTFICVKPVQATSYNPYLRLLADITAEHCTRTIFGLVSLMLMAECDASPLRFSKWDWDPNDSFFRQYQMLNPQQREALHRQASAVGDEPKSSASCSSTDTSVHLEAIRTANMSRTTTNDINRYETHPDALDRIETHRTQHSGTVGAGLKARKSAQKELPPMGAGKPYPPMLPKMEEYVVEFDGFDDPRHAQNWPMRWKLLIGAMLAFDALAATMGSSIFSSAIRGIRETFHVGQEVGILGTSLFVLGYAFGPIMWAPM